jgi:hypothetical protein
MASIRAARKHTPPPSMRDRWLPASEPAEADPGGDSRPAFCAGSGLTDPPDQRTPIRTTPDHPGPYLTPPYQW